MSGPAGDALGTQDSMEDLVQPAIPGVQLNLGPIEPRLQAEVVQQPVAPELGPASALQSGGSEQAPAGTAQALEAPQTEQPAGIIPPDAAPGGQVPAAPTPAANVAPANGAIPADPAAQQNAAAQNAMQQLTPQQQQLLMQQLYLQQQQALLTGQQLNPQQLQALQVMMLMQRNQALLQQQQLMAGRQGGAAAASPYLAGMQATSLSRVAGEAPPAKRQAMDAAALNHQAQILAAQQFRQLHANGTISNMSQSQQQTVFQTLYTRARAQLTAAATSAVPSRGGMRVTIDKRNRAALDKLFNAEDTTDKDHADEVVRRCEEISKALRSHLGKGVKGLQGDGRFGGTDVTAADEYQQVTQKQLIEACGDTARYLKPYQIVGVNFLMLLYRTRIGGAILADEMGLGKTAQLIVYLGAIRALNNDPGPHLVVVPASLLENWQRELRRWCPALKSVVYYGKHRSIVRKRLGDLRARLEAGEEVDDDLADLQDADILAEAAASERVAEAADAAHQEAHDADPLGIEVMHESDDEYDLKRDKAAAAGNTVLPPEPPPPKWDMEAPLAPAPFNVMLTSYTLFERDSPDQRADREFLEGWRWSHLIMDEAHALKNRNAQRTTRLRRVANASRRRIMMTGTPLQNDLVELQNLMHFLLPQVFAAQGFEDFAVMLQGDDKEVKRLTDRMKMLLGPFVLRRLKTEVAGQLTEKKHVTEFIEMTPEQDAMYQASVQSMRNQITGKVADAVGEDGAVEKFVKSLGAKKINHMFTHLRKIAQHPLLIRHLYDDAVVQEIAKKAFGMQLFGGNATLRRVTEELLSYSDYSLHAFCYNSGPEFAMYRLNSTHLMSSTKFKFLADLLPKLKEAGSRPLIFSQWTAVLDVVEWLMEALRLPYVRLDGSTAVDERLATVDRFNTSHEDVFAFLLSTRAGGQGLNLTGADTVIIHDVDFNPQIDRQAEDRCHRLGQTKPVMVYRLITKSSVDHNIYNLSQRKLKLDAAVLDGITTGRGARQREAAQERQQMGFILHSLFAGKDDYEETQVEDDPVPEKAEEKKEEDGAGGSGTKAEAGPADAKPEGDAAAGAGADGADGVKEEATVKGEEAMEDVKDRVVEGAAPGQAGTVAEPAAEALLQEESAPPPSVATAPIIDGLEPMDDVAAAAAPAEPVGDAAAALGGEEAAAPAQPEVV